MGSTITFTSSGFPIMTTPTGLPLPPPPRPDNDGEDEGELSDDDSDLGDDDHHDADHHGPEVKPPPSIPAATSTTTSASSIANSSTYSAPSTSTTPLVASTTLVTSTTSTEARAPAKTSDASFNQSDSTLVNEADPRLEAKAGSSPLGTAGIVLAAVFSFVALLTTFYLLLRLFRRRKAYRADRGRGNGRVDTFNSETSIEKGLPGNWLSTTQETGIIFGGRSRTHSHLGNEQQVQQQPRGRGRFSFLNRRWYSTGTEHSALQPVRSESPSTPPRWGAPLFGLGMRLSRAASSRSKSTTALNEHYATNQNDLQRNLSQSSTGSGYARAYAHHNVRAPVSVARSTISSISSRWLKRRSDSTRSEAASETSDMYRASPRRTTFRSQATGDERGSRDGSQMPRLPLPVAVHSGGRTMSI